MLLVSVLLVILACQLNLGGPEIPSEPIQASTESAESFEDNWRQAFNQAEETGLVTLTITEVQATSLVATKLAERGNPSFTDPQVFLRDGNVQVFGNVQRGSIVASVQIELSVSVDQNGGPKFEITSADFGPLPVPEGLLDNLSAMIDEAFTGEIGSAVSGFQIDGILIADGVMAITGRVR